MLRRILPAFLLLIGAYANCQNQACSTLGQLPQTAFPVCGIDSFHQTTVPQCVNNSVPANTCGSYADTNPFWYQFTCYTTGTLGFLITPNNLDDDYDWELFDLTGHQPAEVYTNPALFVVANWSGSSGKTGTSASSSNNISCGSDPRDNVTTFSEMPMITQGHTYLLLVSHFTPTQSGYSLSFGGGTASIVDPLKPSMISATANCSGEVVNLGLNKRVLCSSLAANGSDFKILPTVAKVIAASGSDCSNSFDMGSLTLTLDKPLLPGDYSLVIQNGSDSSTLLDNCNNNIPPNSTVSFTVFPLVPTPMDSIIPVQCAPDVLSLYFRKPIRCSSVAANGSDFVVTGSYPVSVVSAYADSCIGELSSVIKVKLNKPIQNAGNFSITLKTGSDSNTVLDDCAQETPAGSYLDFITADTVSANFNYSVKLGCVFDTLFYTHDGKNGVTEWDWNFDTSGTGHARDSFFLFKSYGTKHITLHTDNGVCTDSSSVNIVLDNELLSRFNVSPSNELCPEDVIQFSDSSIGKITSWYWIFGDGSSASVQNPSPKKYPAPPTRNGRVYPAALVVRNNIGCFDTSYKMIKVLYNCYIAVPSAFTPNGDGLNDYLYPLNAYKADNLEFRVFNRWGQLVFETKDWTKKWDGKINGNPQAPGTYVWMLRYTNRDTGQLFSEKGTTVLIR